MQFPHYKQLDAMDCGPSCLRMIAKYYGKMYSLEYIKRKTYYRKVGVSLLGISDAAESIGFRTLGAKLSYEQLCDSPLPCIIHWNQKHFVVVTKIDKKRGLISIADPASERLIYKKSEFLNCWISEKLENCNVGIVLLLQTTPDFYSHPDEIINKKNFSYIFNYFKPYKKLILQLFIGMFLGSLLQLILPFLTQGIVDYGIKNKNQNFVILILIAQLLIILGQTSVEIIRSWILLHLTTRINISIISDFILKVMKLPIGFFDTKMIGDFVQRLGDHSRIQDFLTSTSLNLIFSFINIVIFSIVLAIYSFKILLIFLFVSCLYIVWVLFFLKKRRILDSKRFSLGSSNQSTLYQLLTGMQEIKLNNCEKKKRWEWESIQAKLFKVSIQGLTLSQYQQGGATLINESKNIFISYLAATLVIQGQITLGVMMAVQFIIGQLNGPINQLIGFVKSAQDAKISFERLSEIHNKEDEEEGTESKICVLPNNKSITISDLSFQYEGPRSEMVLKNINIDIPEGKITAIVGESGSGKTTLIKLMLGFYKPITGMLKIGNIDLENFNYNFWRSKCGVVMQDGFIFSDSIAENISLSNEVIDTDKLLNATKIANIQEMIESLPMNYNRKIGMEGQGLSAGQKQRILIARAIYKDPDYLFFDEATNSLDTSNEKIIMGNLNQFFKGKTVVIVAHRLSTVKNADQIIVLKKGVVCEQGTHEELTSKKGDYYRLVKNQLELGK